MAERGLKFPNGFVKAKILEFAILNWDGFEESSLRDYLRTIRYEDKRGGKKITIVGVKDTATIKKHLRELKESGYLELIVPSEGGHSNVWRINYSKLPEIAERFPELIPVMQNSDAVHEYIWLKLKRKVTKEFLGELIKLNSNFLKLLLQKMKMARSIKFDAPNIEVSDSLDLSISQEWEYLKTKFGEERRLLSSLIPELELFEYWRYTLTEELEEGYNKKLVKEIDKLRILCEVVHHWLTGATDITRYVLGSEVVERIYENSFKRFDLKPYSLSEKPVNSLKELTELLTRIVAAYTVAYVRIVLDSLEELIKKGATAEFDEIALSIASDIKNEER